MDTLLHYLPPEIEYIIALIRPYDGEGFLFLVAEIVIVLIALQALAMMIHLLLNKQLAWSSKPYSGTGTGSRKILILGDSTAVGTGAAQSSDTIAGRLAHDFPDSQIVNAGMNGGLIRDLRAQIAPYLNETFDLIIVSAGGNDVWHLTRLGRMSQELHYVFTELVRMSNHHVIFLNYNLVVAAPLFPRILQFFLKVRGDAVHRTIRTVARTNQIPVIELFTKDVDPLYTEDQRELFARDGVHPSSRGYALWYNRMWREMNRQGYHY